jgi:RES domain
MFKEAGMSPSTHVARQVALLSDTVGMQALYVSIAADDLIRAHSNKYPPLRWHDPTDLTKSSQRYDSVDYPVKFRSTYAATSALAALAESRKLFVQDVDDDGAAGSCVLITSSNFANTRLSTFAADATLNILPLHKLVPLQFGIVDDIRDVAYDATQAFASLVHALCPEVDGLSYQSRMYPGAICYAIFDRAISRCNLVVATTVFLHENAEVVEAVKSGTIVIIS